MLTWDAERLSFWGIDLHSRRRRRQIVVLTYVAYGIAMFGFTQFNAYYGGFWLMCAASLWMVKFSVFRDGGPVKRFEERTILTDRVRLYDLDDRAKWRHGEKFDALSEAQQQEILKGYRWGSYSVPRKPGDPDKPDEREKRERDQYSRRTLKCLAGQLTGVGLYLMVRLLLCRCGSRPVVLSMQEAFQGMACVFLGLGVYAYTGAKAMILYEEADPSMELFAVSKEA
jgi:hypothetical protein